MSDLPPRLRPLGHVAGGFLPSGSTSSARGDEAHLARRLLEAGAPVDGGPGDPETPLITAARTGSLAVARVLIDAGADLEAVAAPDAIGVPEGTALLHAAVFGRTEIVDLLVAQRAKVPGLGTAAAAGDLRGWSVSRATLESRVDALVFAADHQRLHVIDQLLAAGTPVDAEDEVWGRQALRVAARNGRAASVEHLLLRGADPQARDPQHGRTALDWLRLEHESLECGTRRRVVDLLLGSARPVLAEGA